MLYRRQLHLFQFAEPSQDQRHVRSSHWSNKLDSGSRSYPEDLKKPLGREVKHPVSCETALIITVTWTTENFINMLIIIKPSKPTRSARFCACGSRDRQHCDLRHGWVSVSKSWKRQRRQSRPLNKYHTRSWSFSNVWCHVMKVNVKQLTTAIRSL